MYRLSRFLAVIALALSPVWGVQSIHAASSPAPLRFPYWPSFFSSGCSAVTGPFGGVTFSCGTGAYATTQITSAYGGCSEIDISVDSFGSGPFIVTADAPVGGISNTVSINSTGNYYIQLNWVPSTTIGPIAIQFSTPDTGNMSLSTIEVNPCAVPTNTPIPTNTNTPNPSDTATAVPPTATEGPSHTPTPIPTNTPLPSGHNTFTPTVTRTGTITPAPTGTATATATPGPSYRNCGSPDFPVLNCDWVGGSVLGNNPVNWVNSDNGPAYINCGYPGITEVFSNISNNTWFCAQTVTAHASGSLMVRYQETTIEGGNSTYFQFQPTSGGSVTRVNINQDSCPVGGGTFCAMNVGEITGSTGYYFGPAINSGGGEDLWRLYIDNVWVGTSFTPTPVPTGTTTSTPTASATSVIPPATQTAIAALTLTSVAPSFTPTPVPIPGAMSTNIPTSTECPGGCAVAALTQIPGFATRVTVDTSPFDPLKALSLSRSSCQPFGYAQIPYPVIHGTPVFGSTTPLSVTWTVADTSTWNDSTPYSNTAIQPCAMVKEIPTVTWDITYWLSVLMLAIGYFLWLLGFVGRFSGDHSIDG